MSTWFWEKVFICFNKLHLSALGLWVNFGAKSLPLSTCILWFAMHFAWKCEGREDECTCDSLSLVKKFGWCIFDGVRPCRASIIEYPSRVHVILMDARWETPYFGEEDNSFCSLSVLRGHVCSFTLKVIIYATKHLFITFLWHLIEYSSEKCIGQPNIWPKASVFSPSHHFDGPLFGQREKITFRHSKSAMSQSPDVTTRGQETIIFTLHIWSNNSSVNLCLFSSSRFIKWLTLKKSFVHQRTNDDLQFSTWINN